MAITRRQLLRAGAVAGAAAALPVSGLLSPHAHAAANPYIGTVMVFGGNFAPAGWALCDGSLLPISENDALFTLIGTTYGGDGQSTFGLPDLRGRFPVHQGSGFVLGQMGGVETVTLTTNQVPAHSHAPRASSSGSTQSGPGGAVWGQGTTAKNYASGAPNAAMASDMVQTTGGSQPHENMMPFVGLTFCIALFGIFPPQS